MFIFGSFPNGSDDIYEKMKDGICSSVLSKQDIRLVATLKTPKTSFITTLYKNNLTPIELVHIEIKMLLHFVKVNEVTPVF